MSTRHTPGPWIVEAVGPWLEVANEETLYTVAKVNGSGQGPQANACLIAAAPDLLEACRTLIETGDLQAAIDKARAAIARAEGTR